MERPLGVTILACLMYLGALAMTALGVVLMVGMGLIGAAVGGTEATGSGAGMAMLASLGLIGGIVCLIFAGLHGAIGMGLWKLKNWARVTTLVLTGIGVLINSLGLLAALMAMEIFSIMWVGVQLGLGVWIVMYLMKPETKQAFAPRPLSAAAHA